MELTARDAARLLSVPEETIYAWIRNGTVPSYRVRDKYRLNRVELLEWATARNMKLSPEIFREKGHRPPESPLTHALRRGGVIHDLDSRDKTTALAAACRAIPLPPHVDRDELNSVLVAREALCSTGIGNGVAIPHPRGPIVLGIPESQITVAFLRHPIEFGAIDRRPVGVLFVIVSTTVRTHLLLLSHLMHALQDTEFRRLLDVHAGQDEIVARAEILEALMSGSNDGRGATE